jgi:phage terminase Nu1 subunit (DNA packaging protein)
VAKTKEKAAGTLKGWAEIARFLGLTPASAQRWAKEGMPVKKVGRFTVADPAELQAWLGRESHMKAPAHVMTEDADIAAALKESISVAKGKKG